MATFGEKLSAEIQRRGGPPKFGLRTVARLIDPTNVESNRRSLYKYVNGEDKPKRPRRELIEDALGLERGSLKDDDEDESLANDLLEIAGSMAPGWRDSKRVWIEQQRERIFREAAERSAA